MAKGWPHKAGSYVDCRGKETHAEAQASRVSEVSVLETRPSKRQQSENEAPGWCPYERTFGHTEAPGTPV